MAYVARKNEYTLCVVVWKMEQWSQCYRVEINVTNMNKEYGVKGPAPITRAFTIW